MGIEDIAGDAVDTGMEAGDTGVNIIGNVVKIADDDAGKTFDEGVGLAGDALSETKGVADEVAGAGQEAGGLVSDMIPGSGGDSNPLVPDTPEIPGIGGDGPSLPEPPAPPGLEGGMPDVGSLPGMDMISGGGDVKEAGGPDAGLPVDLPDLPGMSK